MAEPWDTLDAGDIAGFRVFGVQSVSRRSRTSRREGEFQVIHSPDWVNVIALTPGGDVVLVEQYRHGTDAVTVEIPGGMVDPGEDHATAAARELAEETGYTGAPPILLGTVHPNPAIQNNACSTWLIANARRTAPPRPDDDEEIDVITRPLAGIDALVADGTITHALVIAAFTFLRLHQG